MRWILSVRQLLLCAAAWLFSWASAVQAAPVAMVDCSGMPCAMVTVGGAAPLKLLIDIGDNHSVLDTAVAKSMGLALEPVNNAQGQPIPGYFKTTLKDVRLGDRSLGDFRVLVTDVHSQMAQGSMPNADGLLAYVDLNDRVLTLDYRHKTIDVSAPGESRPCSQRCGAITYPTFGAKGPPIVVTTGFEVNGQQVTMQVDTLYAGTMLIYPTSVSKLGLDQQAASKTIRRAPFTDGGVDTIEGRVDRESFAGKTLIEKVPVYFATPGVHLPDGFFDGTVGASLFANRVITLDFHANHFWME